MNIYLKEAYKEAIKASKLNEIPIGCVIVKNDKIVGRGFNTKEQNNSIINHAEINAILDASKNLGTYDLSGCDLFVTIEPCLMCSGAIIQAKIRKVYYGYKEEKMGGVESKARLFDIQPSNHYVLYENLNEIDCLKLVQTFFQSRR